jgi:hypothetical protein
MSPARIAVTVLFVLALSAASRTRAGVLIEGTSSDRESKGPERFLVEGQRVRIESKGGEHAAIFDGASKRMIQLDAPNRSYTEITEADMAKIRAMMAERSGAPERKPLSRRYEKTGKTDKALGNSCDVYRAVGSDGQSHEELCVAPFGTFGVQRSDFEGFRALGLYASSLAGRDGESSWADLPGVPLIAWRTRGGAREESFRATKVEKRSIPASEFSAPAGWTKKPGPAEQLEQLQLRQMQRGAGHK